MGILWAGGEDLDILAGHACAVSQTGGQFASGYARCGLDIFGNTYSILNTFPGGAVTSLWLSFRIYTALTYTGRYIGLGTVGTLAKGLYLGVNSAVKFTLSKFDGTDQTNLVTETTPAVPDTNLSKIDIQIIDFGAAATVNVYLDGGSQPMLTYTGDVTVSGLSNLSNVIIGGGGGVISEIIVADQDTRALRLATLAVNGAGDANQWDGDGYGGIDEIVLNDADLIYTDTADEDFQAALSDCPSGTFDVLAAVVSARACKSGDASIQTLELGFKSGVTVDVDAGRTLTTNWKPYNRIATTIAGAPITTSVLNAVQLDLQSET